MPLITSLVDAFLPDGDIEVSLDPESDPMKIPAKALVNSLLDALFNQSQSIEIGIGLTKYADTITNPFQAGCGNSAICFFSFVILSVRIIFPIFAFGNLK